MNPELEEQKIRQWFREARHGDESRAPSFVDMLAAAQSKTRRGGWRLSVWRIAFVTVALIAIGVSAVVFKQSVTQPLTKAAAGSNVEPSLNDQHSLVAVDPPSPRFVRARPINGSLANSRRSPRRPRVAQPQGEFGQAAFLSLKWQSPTDFLLRTPGTELLKTVPRLGDSLVRFDVIQSDEKN